jgi:hypothetical protein
LELGAAPERQRVQGLTRFISPAGDVQIPGPPTNVQACEISRNYVVLSWDPPTPRGKEPLMYFIEKVRRQAPDKAHLTLPHVLCLMAGRRPHQSLQLTMLPLKMRLREVGAEL